jgi:hypothetical protein
MKGAHDDAIMSIAIAFYAGDVSFSQLKRNEQQSKAMLESWTMSERTYESNRGFYSYGSSFDSVGSMSMDGNQNSGYRNTPNNNASKQMYQEYGWLFGAKKGS